MGCDIHMYVEKILDGKWQTCDKWAIDEGQRSLPYENSIYDERDYNLFATLAGVRNYNNIIPWSEPRGLPKDTCVEIKEAANHIGEDGHTHSYYSLAELKEHLSKSASVTLQGVVDAANYFAWKANGEPNEWSGSCGGGRIEVCTHYHLEQKNDFLNSEIGKYFREKISLFTVVSWTKDLTFITKDFAEKVIPRLNDLAQGEDSSVRIVFWFDN